MLDVIVVGGGPAGLSAALLLGRCRRRVLLCDSGTPRNLASHGLHGYLTRDGIPPTEFVRLGREELSAYPSLEVCDQEVVDARRLDGRFEITLAGGRRAEARRLLLATGVMDELPQVEGIEAFYGRSVFHCPYCDGWEVQDLPIAAYGKGDAAVGLALGLTRWTGDVILCTDGPSGLGAIERRPLERNGIGLREEPLLRLEGAGGELTRIVFEAGDPLPRKAMFFHTGQRQRSTLPGRLGCVFNDEGTVQTDEHEATNVPGLFVAGDASRRVQFAVVAAAEGARAAAAIHESLVREEI